jgi:hypothetical protein
MGVHHHHQQQQHRLKGLSGAAGHCMTHGCVVWQTYILCHEILHLKAWQLGRVHSRLGAAACPHQSVHPSQIV